MTSVQFVNLSQKRCIICCITVFTLKSLQSFTSGIPEGTKYIQILLDLNLKFK